MFNYLIILIKMQLSEQQFYLIPHSRKREDIETVIKPNKAIYIQLIA